MGGGIYLIQSDGALVELREEPYESEDLLQRLLAPVMNAPGSNGSPFSSTSRKRWPSRSATTGLTGLGWRPAPAAHRAQPLATQTPQRTLAQPTSRHSVVLSR